MQPTFEKVTSSSPSNLQCVYVVVVVAVVVAVVVTTVKKAARP
jgi:hypothetical protein